MKYLVLVALLMVGVLAELEVEEVACINDLHLDKEVIEKLINEEVYKLDNEDFMKYLACFGKKTGFQNEDGSLVLHKIEEAVGWRLNYFLFSTPFFSMYLIGKALEKCSKKRFAGSNGQIVAQAHNCFFETLTSYYEENWSFYQEDKDDCIARNKVDKAVIEHKMKDLYLPEDDKHINRYMGCLLYKAQVLIENEIEWFRVESLMGYKINRLFHDKAGSTFKLAQHFEKAKHYCKYDNLKGRSLGQTGVKIHNCVVQYFDQRLH